MSEDHEFAGMQKGWEPSSSEQKSEQNIPNFLKSDKKSKPEDPWRHRSEHMRCISCMWFVTKQGSVGRCRRHAPIMSGYPVVFNTDWCGDHKLDETKIG